MNGAAYTQAFGALQRLLLVLEPAFGEGRWRAAHSFERLPAESRSPGHWYRFEGGGYGHVDENLNGQYLKELPPDVDPSTVIQIPGVPHLTILQTMKLLLPKMDAAQRPRFQATLDELEKTARPDREQTYLRNFQHTVYAALLASPQTLLQYLTKAADFHSGDGLIEGKASGREGAATLLVRALADAVAPEKTRGVRILGMLAAPGAQSLEDMAVRMVRDCAVNDFSAEVDEVLAALLREGNGLVEAAREGYYLPGRPESMLEFYYAALFHAAPYLRAAMVGYEIAGKNPELGRKERQRYATLANAAEEKLARVTDAMFFSVRDLDGSQFRLKRAAIQSLLAAGEQEKAEGLAMEAVDLKLFFPKPFKQALLRPDPA